MKVQFYGDGCFLTETKENAYVFQPTKEWKKKVDIAFLEEEKEHVTREYAKKTIALPGEFEISGVLVRAFYSDDKSSLIYKAVAGEISTVYFGNITQMPSKEFLKKLGENIDIVYIILNEDFNGKKVREFLETLDPRVAFLGGDVKFFPKMVELGAKIESEETFPLTRGMMNEEKLDLVILPEVGTA